MMLLKKHREGMYKIMKKKVYNDFFLNIIASLLLTFATQIIAFPLTSSLVSVKKYGEILTLIAFMNIFAVTFGNTLNNSRLLMKDNNINKEIESNFNLLWLILSITNSLLIYFLLFSLGKYNLYMIFIIILSSNFLLFRAYYTVEYRLSLNYKRIFNVSLYSLIGYSLGGIVATLTNEWIIIFFLGELFPIIYIAFNSSLLKYKISYNPIFWKIYSNFFYLVIAAFLLTLINYLDRLIINPMIGAKYVSIFVVSSFLGKTIGVVLGPISGVLLSYYVKENNINLKSFYKRLFYYFVLGIIGFICIVILGRPFIYILYPKIYPYINPYFYIANFGAILFILGNLIQPNLLVVTKAYISTVIQIIYFFIYIILSYIFIKEYQLIGFCYAIIISNFCRIILMITFTHINIKYTKNVGSK